MAEEEPITSPDQHRPMVSHRLARFGAIVTVLLLVAMARIGNHEGQVENIFLYSIAGLILLVLIGEVVLRRRGLIR